MSDYYQLAPEVAGGLGENTVIDRVQVPPRVLHLHHVFDDWLGDELLECYPCYIVTKEMAEKLSKMTLSGYILRDIETSASEMYDDWNPNQELPRFAWLDVMGIPGRDDFGLEKDARLIVSERALTSLQSGKLNHCSVKPHAPE